MLRSVNYHPILHLFKNSEDDRRLRVNFCRWALNVLDQDLDLFCLVVFMTKLQHWLSQQVIIGYQLIDSESEWISIDRILYVWVEILNGRIIGPHFFEQIINCEIYSDFFFKLFTWRKFH